jgi:hypothetical protein
MHLKNLPLIIAAFVIIGISACKKDNNANNKTITKKDTITTTPGTDVYVAGSITSSQSEPVATYWKNGVAHALADSSVDSYTYGLAIADTDVYIVGVTSSGATLWKNGKASVLTNGNMALGITISGGDVYVAGISTIPGGTGVATYWKNGTPVTLTDNLTPSVAVSIAVLGSDVYVAGYLAAAGNNNTVCYWKNGVIQNQMSTSASTFGYSVWGSTCLAVIGSDVYVTGAVENTTDTQLIATYWKNGSQESLTTDGAQISSAINAVTTNGSDIYYVGYDDAMATYWLNGTAYHLNPNSQQFIATGIALTPDTYAPNGMDVYVAGYSGYATTNAVYWKNGMLKTLSTRMSTACGIGVVKHK